MKTDRTEGLLKAIFYGGMILFTGLLLYASWVLEVGSGLQIAMLVVVTFGVIIAAYGLVNLKLSRIESKLDSLQWLNEEPK